MYLYYISLHTFRVYWLSASLLPTAKIAVAAGAGALACYGCRCFLCTTRSETTALSVYIPFVVVIAVVVVFTQQLSALALCPPHFFFAVAGKKMFWVSFFRLFLLLLLYYSPLLRISGSACCALLLLVVFAVLLLTHVKCACNLRTYRGQIANK